MRTAQLDGSDFVMVRRHLFAAILVASLTCGGPQHLLAADERTFPVAAGDHLEIVVHGGENISTVLTGRFRIGADGSIYYPVLGKLEVAGLNPDEIAALLGESLSAHFPVSPPLITVAEYAPVFLIGDVVRPGPFQFQPGMTVLQLVLLSGGMAGESASATARHSRLQEIRSLELTRFALQVRKARIAAEINGAAFNHHLFDEEARRLGAQGTVAAEAAILRSRQRAQDSRRRSHQAQAAGYDQEIASVEESIGLHDEELELLVEQLRVQVDLADRGLAAQTARRDVQRQLAASRREALEFRTALYRAKQNRLAVDQALIEIEIRQEEENVKELRDIEIAFDQNTVALFAERAKLGNLPQPANDSAEILLGAPKYQMIREVNGERSSKTIMDSYKIGRGDIIVVSLSSNMNEDHENSTDTSDYNVISNMR